NGDVYTGVLDSEFDSRLSSVITGAGVRYTTATTKRYGALVSTSAQEGESLEFGEADFSRETVNANSDRYSAIASNGAVIVGITIDEEGNIFTKNGSSFDITIDGQRYMGTLNGEHALNSWTDGLQYENRETGLLKGVTAFGKNPETGVTLKTNEGIIFNNGTFEADFSATAINADSMSYSAYDEATGVWIQGVEVFNGKMYNVAGAQVMDSQGNVLVELSGSDEIANWEHTYYKDQLLDLSISVNSQIGDNELTVVGETLVLTRTDGTRTEYTIDKIKDGTFLSDMLDLIPNEPLSQVPKISEQDREAAKTVWWYMHGSYEGMTDVDAYYISSIFKIYCRDFGVYSFSDLSRDNLNNYAASVANMLNCGYGPLSTLGNLYFEKAFDPDDKDHEAYMGQIQIAEMELNKYGPANMAYMVYQAGGNSAIRSNYVKLLQYKYGLGNGSDKKLDINVLITRLYGETMTSYESEIFSSIISLVDYYCDAYADTRWAVTGIDRVGLSEARETLENAIQNAIENGLGKDWLMNSEGTVIANKHIILLSSDSNVPSGMYTLGIRNDGTYTAIDSNNSYGIIGRYSNVDMNLNKVGPDFDVIYEYGISNFGDNNGVFILDRGANLNIYLLDDENYVAQQVSNLPNENSGNEPVRTVQTRAYGLDVIFGTDTTTYIARGKGSKITIDASTGSAFVFGEGARYLNGVTIFANGADGSDRSRGAEIDFESGFLVVKNGAIVTTDNFEASFANEQSAINYARDYIGSQYVDAGLEFVGILGSDGELLDLEAAGERLASMKFNVSPFNYLAVMNNIHDEDNEEVGFGVRFDVATESATFVDVSGIATLTTNGVDSVNLFSEKLDSGEYIEKFTVASVSPNRQATVSTELDSNFVQTSGTDFINTPTILEVGDRISLGAILHHNNAIISTSQTVTTVGPNGEIIELNGASFTGDIAGRFVLANTVLLNGQNGIVYQSGNNEENQFVIKNILKGSIVQLGPVVDGTYNLNVLCGKSNVDVVIQGSVVDTIDVGAGDGLSSNSVALFAGVLTEERDGSSTTVTNGLITGWKTSTMSQDFTLATIKREGSTWAVGSYIDGHYVKENAKVNAQGVIDSKYYKKSVGEVLVGIAVAAVSIAITIIAAVATFGAAVPVIIAAAIAAAVLIAPAAFEHGVALTAAIDRAQRKNDWSIQSIANIALNAGLIVLDFISAFTLGVSIGTAAAAGGSFGQILTNGIKNYLSGKVSMKSVEFAGKFGKVASKVATFLSKAPALTKLALSVTRFGTLTHYGNVVKEIGQKIIVNSSISDDIKYSVADCFGQAVDMAVMLLSFSSGGGALKFSVTGAAIIGGFIVGTGVTAAIQYSKTGQINWLQAFSNGAVVASIAGLTTSIISNGFVNTFKQIGKLFSNNWKIIVGTVSGVGVDLAIQFGKGKTIDEIDWGEVVTWGVFGAFVGSTWQHASNYAKMADSLGKTASKISVFGSAVGFVAGGAIYAIKTAVSGEQFSLTKFITFGMLGGMITGGLVNLGIEKGLVKTFEDLTKGENALTTWKAVRKMIFDGIKSVLHKGLDAYKEARGNLNGLQGLRKVASDLTISLINKTAATFSQSLNMISRMSVFNEATGLILTWLNIDSGGKVVDFIESNSFLKGLDSLGLNLGSQIKYYTDLAANGSFWDSATAVTSGANQLLYTPQMYLFSFGVNLGMKFLAPVLQNMPGLGELMKALGSVHTGVSVLDTAFEEGVKESLPGFFLQDAGSFGEVLQELFDETPDCNFNRGMEVLERLAADGAGIVENGGRIRNALQQRQARRELRQAVNNVNDGLKTVQFETKRDGTIIVSQAKGMEGIFSNQSSESVEFRSSKDVQTMASDLVALVGGSLSLEVAYQQADKLDRAAVRQGQRATAERDLNLDLRMVSSKAAEIRSLDLARRAVKILTPKDANTQEYSQDYSLVELAIRYSQQDSLSPYTFSLSEDNTKVVLIEENTVVAEINVANALEAANAVATMMGQVYSCLDANSRITDIVGENITEVEPISAVVKYNTTTHQFDIDTGALQTMINNNMNIIRANNAIKEGHYSEAITALVAVYGANSFVYNENGTVTIRTSNGNYNVHGNRVTIAQGNLKYAVDLITRFGGVQSLDLRCISTSHISQATRAQSYRELISAIGLQNVI
ncbi:MAG: hypothetical protein IKN42_08120, partial [Elusimicrobia bacterium]|nr:hypothetical protein [Elusimicrobiota bacterium]